MHNFTRNRYSYVLGSQAGTIKSINLIGGKKQFTKVGELEHIAYVYQ